MKKLNINLEYCHGIKKLETELDFSEYNVVAIYAPNGMMKTSFGKTFRNISDGVSPKDAMFPDRNTVCEIKDENNNELIKENIFVIKSYNEEYSSENMSTLLVDKELKTEYEEVYKKIDQAKSSFLKRLKPLSGLNPNVIEGKILEIFHARDFFEVIENTKTKVLIENNPSFVDISYNKIFNDKSFSFLNTSDFKTQIKEYIERYSDLLSNSKYLKQGFDHYKAFEVQENLKSNGFFKAQHSVNLYDGKFKQEVANESDFEKIIQTEKNSILNDDKLLEKWEKIDRQLSANIELRSLRDYLFDHKEILPELANLEIFAEKMWISYFIAQKGLFENLLKEYNEGKLEIKKIIECAKKQETDWKSVIDIFNSRFFVPFEVTIGNQVDVILKSAAPKVQFNFKDLDNRTPVEKIDLLDVLSDGEKRALYLLNIIFEVEARSKTNQEMLFIVDDIADSFDYKNKYAIIRYLKEISENSVFKQIILTHNFDFFRTILSRGIVHRENCFFSYKTDDEVRLESAEGIKNPFRDWMKHLNDSKKFIASIPFVRNIIEYTRDKDDPDYKTLTSLIHWEDDTKNILMKDLENIFCRHFPNIKFPTSGGNHKVVDKIFEESTKCLTANEGVNLENKIVLSIGIRLQAEYFMTTRINDNDFVSKINSNRTFKLFQKYKQLNQTETEILTTLDRVNLMTPENIHLNSFMYEPILDMSDRHLIDLYKKVSILNS